MNQVQDRARVPVAKEGWPFILAPALLALLLAVAGCLWGGLIFFGLACGTTFFFRDPERTFSAEQGAVVSPADGKIVFLGQVEASPLGGGPAVKVSIFMNICDVHVHRSPAGGQVVDLKYVPGQFFNASLDKASEKNERLHLALQTEEGTKMEVVQIAGLIARRIVCWVRPGDRLEAGERLGMIRFGSRVDLYLPLEIQLWVGHGQRVKAGQSLIGKLS
ncbi:MAG: phosphatidylserine decarboxylase family protein [Deltaproteobacteria bacterium]|nr:phosphatidylserine decarboxylase family protein [Deltaproteobacteria bacterium]